MKKSLFSLLLACLLLMGCEPIPQDNHAVVIEPATIELIVGQSATLTATIEPAMSAAITWASDNASVATIDANGVVTAIAEGTATITASAEGATAAQCQVSVVGIPSSFPRTFVIEHFTGDGCGFCPGGMYAIVDHIANATTPYIWLSHHYGYNNDEYTIPANSKIGKMLGVQVAPNMVLNRTKQDAGMAFHPGYLPEITVNDETTADASVEIKHTFNPDTRMLDVTVSGITVHADTGFLLSVLIKENRLVGKQTDYTYSWKGGKWKEYMHARVVRDMLTDPFGDAVIVENHHYSKTFSYEVDAAWVPENCCVVAYITSLDKKPIINAHQVPLVEGTTGGEQYNPYGITEGQGPNKSVTFDSIQVKKAGDNVLEVMLFSSKSIRSEVYGPLKAVAVLYLNTSATTLEPGTYLVQEGTEAGTITAGYRVDEKATLGGSILAYALSKELLAGTLIPAHMWRINTGDMVVEENGNIVLTFETYGGTIVTGKYQVVTEE